MEMDRRSALALIAFDALGARYMAAQEHAAHSSPATVLPPLPATPQFFHPDEFALLHRLTEMILPSDEHSGGAIEANVPRFIDFVLSKSPPADQQRWRAGLEAFDRFSTTKESASFVDLKPDTQARLLDAASTGKSPDDARVFFESLRKETIFAYYTTEIGLLRELGYRGNQVRSGFPGCGT